jgi:YVTN family beta-propeller protein
MCLAPDGKTLFVSTAGSKSVTVVDLARRAATGSLTAPGMESPDGCAVSADSQKVYSVDSRAGAVFTFSAESKAFLKKIAVGKEPRRAVVSRDGKIIVTNAQSNSLSIIDPATDEVVRTVKTGEEPRDLTYSPDQKQLAVGLIGCDCVQFFKAGTLEPVHAVGGVKSPQHLEFSPDGQRLYIVGKLSDNIGVMRVGGSPRMARTIDIPHTPLGLGDAWGMALSPDGRFMFVSNMGDDTIALVDVEMMEAVHAFPGGKGNTSVLYIKPTGGVSTMTSAGKLERFRSLAESAMSAVHRGDMTAAAQACHTLELEWDSSESDLRRASPDVWNQIDESMDGFIHPITGAGGKTPDMAALNTAYHTFLAKMKLAQ